MDSVVLSTGLALQVISPMRIVFVLVPVVVLVVGVVFALRVAFGGRKSRGNAPEPLAAAGVLLNCPHCGEETEAASSRCRHCGKDL